MPIGRRSIGTTQPGCIGRSSRGSATSPMRKISQPRCFWPLCGPLRISASMPEVRAYLRATARTVLAAHWRATLGREITSIEDIAAAPDSEEAISMAPQRVRVVLEALPDNYRRILELRFCRGARSRTPRRKWVSAWPTPRCCNTAPCGWRRRLTGRTSDERARAAALYRRPAARSPSRAVPSRRLRGRADPHRDRPAGGSTGQRHGLERSSCPICIAGSPRRCTAPGQMYPRARRPPPGGR